MGKVKRLELWWQLYRTSLPVRDLHYTVTEHNSCLTALLKPDFIPCSAGKCTKIFRTGYSVMFLLYHVTSSDGFSWCGNNKCNVCACRGRIWMLKHAEIHVSLCETNMLYISCKNNVIYLIYFIFVSFKPWCRATRGWHEWRQNM